MRRCYSRVPCLSVISIIAPLLCSSLGCSRTIPSAKDTSAAESTAAATGTVTFNRDVAPIVFAKCASCHRPGEAAPFSLLTYDDVRGRASQIVEVTQRGFMPPWLPHEGHGEFVGVRRLSDQEIETLATWAASDTPQGDVADLPNPPEFPEGWQLGPPDLVLESPPYTVAAGGGDQFRNFVIPIELGARAGSKRSSCGPPIRA